MSKFYCDKGIPNNAIYNLEHDGDIYVVQLISNPSSDVDLYFNPDRIYKRSIQGMMINIVKHEADDDLLLELENEVSMLNQELMKLSKDVKLVYTGDIGGDVEQFNVYYKDIKLHNVQYNFYPDSGEFTVKFLEDIETVKEKLYNVFKRDFVTNYHIIDLAYLRLKGTIT